MEPVNTENTSSNEAHEAYRGLVRTLTKPKTSVAFLRFLIDNRSTLLDISTPSIGHFEGSDRVCAPSP